MKTPTLYLLSLLLAPLLYAVPDLSIANKIGYAYYGTPTIDGIISEGEWEEAAAPAPNSINLFIQNSNNYTPPTDENDLSGDWLALWDETALYLLLTVKDDIIQDFSNDPILDSFEIFISTAYTRYFGEWNNPGYDLVSDFHAQFFVDNSFDGSASHGPHSFGMNVPISYPVQYRIVPTEDGYFAEVALPWEFVMGDTTESEVTFENGIFYGGQHSDIYGDARDFIGFDIHLRDNDGADSGTKSKVAWNDGYDRRRGDFHWADTEVWGTLVLVQPDTWDMKDALFTYAHWGDMGNNIVFNYSTESFYYVGHNRFLYGFAEDNWWYVPEEGSDPQGFFVFDYKKARWFFVFEGYFIDFDPPCTVTNTVFVNPYWTNEGDHFVSGNAYFGFLYTELCPYFYNYVTESWWYINESNATAKAFYAYDFGSEQWSLFSEGSIIALQ